MANDLFCKGRLKKKIDNVVHTFYPETGADQVFFSDKSTLEEKVAEITSSTEVLDAACAYTDMKIQEVMADFSEIESTLEELSTTVTENKTLGTQIVAQLALKANIEDVVQLSGSTMTGDLKINRNNYDGIDDTTLVTKAEVDYAIIHNSGRFLIAETEPNDLRDTDVWFELV